MNDGLVVKENALIVAQKQLAARARKKEYYFNRNASIKKGSAFAEPFFMLKVEKNYNLEHLQFC